MEVKPAASCIKLRVEFLEGELNLLESVADKKDFEILVRLVVLEGLLPLKWPRTFQNYESC